MKEKGIQLFNRIKATKLKGIGAFKRLREQNKRKAYLLLGAAAGGGILLLAGLTVLLALGGGEQTVYRETQAVKGRLTVGVTESGSVSIGTAEQTFDLDISEYTGGDEISFATGASGSMGGMGDPGSAGGISQIFGQTGTSSGDSRALKVEAVYVTAGEEITEGTPLLKLTEESVENIRQELSEDVSDAQITYQQLTTSGRQTGQQAEAALASDILYAAAAQSEYDSSVHTLEDAVEELEQQVTDTEEELAEKSAELEESRALLEEQRQVLANAQYSAENTDRESNLYWWIVAVNTVSDTEALVESLEDGVESAEDEIEQLNTELEQTGTELALARKALAEGTATAGTQLALRQFRSENAQEIYDVTTGQSDFETQNARKDYEKATQKLKDFDAMIVDGVISSSYSGVLTKVGIAAGDSLEQDTSLITLNDYGETTITLEVEEEDMDAAAMGNAVNVTFTAFPEEVFKGTVTEIGDASIDSNTNRTTWSVTVTVDGNGGGLYEGMSAEATFITKQSEEVIYISNRAVIREGTVSYVKVKDDSGRITKTKIVTGFSDGINVEVKEGLSEGDIVLIEA